MSTTIIPTIVLGGTGYVAGELLRLLVTHPQLEVVGVMSESKAGEPIKETFPQLQDGLGNLCFGTKQEMLAMLGSGQYALFSAAPHGASAALVAEFITQAEQSNCELTVVDVSADFRYADADAYAAVYGQPHGAPELLDQFASALPEHLTHTDKPHIGHPGCFATALLIASVPLMKLGLTEPSLYAVGITGSTGSGRTPTAGTHHPERQSNLYAYKPLNHRHAPEVTGICESVAGQKPQLQFIPHSGPFARGIHMTMQAQLTNNQSADDVRTALDNFYGDSAFISIVDGTPKIKNIVGSNYAHVGVAAENGSVAVFVVIDNLVKGAAGGAVQWMNRQLGFNETTGLTSPALAWT
ncbi:MAG: N-acetyl-gamma-glutamyl-phosphate reductase [Gammaproteobacteria bacterium]|nr:N-acetyl-gamma-glutamyl-phosphate reductase [Gammaproteobacteria bacterium]